MRILKSEWSFMVNHSIQLCMTIWSYMRYHKLMTDLFCTWTSMCASNEKKKHDPYCRKHHISDALRFCKRNVVMWACSFCSLPHTWHTRVTGEGKTDSTFSLIHIQLRKPKAGSLRWNPQGFWPGLPICFWPCQFIGFFILSPCEVKRKEWGSSFLVLRGRKSSPPSNSSNLLCRTSHVHERQFPRKQHQSQC